VSTNVEPGIHRTRTIFVKHINQIRKPVNAAVQQVHGILNIHRDDSPDIATLYSCFDFLRGGEHQHAVRHDQGIPYLADVVQQALSRGDIAGQRFFQQQTLRTVLEHGSSDRRMARRRGCDTHDVGLAFGQHVAIVGEQADV
jgi:hypothetical protein